MIRALALLVVVVSAIGALVAYSIVSRGLSARDEPSRAEEILARAMRRWATPEAERARVNPVPATEDVQAEALAHYADHCATCHANDGSGETTVGRALYPRAPDMRAAATQSLTDGELFYAIEQGIPWTGMPAWGDGSPDSERESWTLVHFVRNIPKLTPADLRAIEKFVPRARMERERVVKPMPGSKSDPLERLVSR
jgi:mono/diheme cytochrome c family protein